MIIEYDIDTDEELRFKPYHIESLDTVLSALLLVLMGNFLWFSP